MAEEVESVSIPTAEEAIDGLIARLVAEKNTLKAQIKRLEKACAPLLASLWVTEAGNQGGTGKEALAYVSLADLHGLRAALCGSSAPSVESAEGPQIAPMPMMNAEHEKFKGDPVYQLEAVNIALGELRVALETQEAEIEGLRHEIKDAIQELQRIVKDEADPAEVAARLIENLETTLEESSDG